MAGERKTERRSRSESGGESGAGGRESERGMGEREMGERGMGGASGETGGRRTQRKAGESSR